MAINCFQRMRKRLKGQCQQSTVQANSKDIDMQFGIQKWEIVEEGYKYLEFTEAQKNKEQKMKEIFQIEYLKGTRLALQSKLNCRNKIKAIITWAVSLMRYGEGKIGWKKNEPQNLERGTRKLVTICIKLTLNVMFLGSVYSEYAVY